MPHSIYIACSGISLLLSTAVFGQVPPLPRHPTQQQIVGYHLQQQREWNLRQLPPNSVLYKAAPKFNTSLSYTLGWKADELPAYNTPYGFTAKLPPTGLGLIKDDYYDYRKSPFLKNYLTREIPNLFNFSTNYPYNDRIGAAILREILFPSHPRPKK
jgi:hypothetical protein